MAVSNSTLILVWASITVSMALFRWLWPSPSPLEQGGRANQIPIVGFDSLTDDTIFDILCKLSVDQIVRCSAVCKRWKNVIRDPCFSLNAEALSSSWTIFLTQEYKGTGTIVEEVNCAELFFIDDLTKLTEIKYLRRLKLPRKLPANRFTNIDGNCNGIILFGELIPPSNSNVFLYFVYNPVTGQSVELGELDKNTQVCGFYKKKYEYCLVCVTGSGILDHSRFSIRGLQRNYYKALGDYPFMLVSKSHIAFISDGYLYRLVYSYPYPNSPYIMMLNLETEELQFKTCPEIYPWTGTTHAWSSWEWRLTLLEGAEGGVYFCQHTWDYFKVSVLVDRQSWSWTQIANINLLHDSFYTPELQSRFRTNVPWKRLLQPLAVKESGLMIFSARYGVLWFDTQTRRLGAIGRCSTDLIVRSTTCRLSLASL